MKSLFGLTLTPHNLSRIAIAHADNPHAMDGSAPRISWSPLDKLANRFFANVDALAGRYPELAQTLRVHKPPQNYYILPGAQEIQIGAGNGTSITPLPQSVTPATATNIMRQMFPAAMCTQPALVAGEDLGWLWNGLYELPCHTPAAPGHHPPLFFLVRDIERLWIILHIHDWRDLLADTRVRLFTGESAMADFRQSLVADTACPWPRLSVRVDPTLWSGTPTLDEILAEATAMSNQVFLEQIGRFRMAYDNRTPEAIVAQLNARKTLKILGITSRFTTFLQYSMRDWLKAFERLGHQTRLVIESHDHEACNGLGIAAACAEFLPDLVVIIDHYRQELKGIPDQIPVVMWVQDALPNIFRREAGAAQGPLDYSLGFARLRMIQEYGYPADRYMSAVVGCDAERFAPRDLSPDEQAQLGCDVSFVSHASVPADVILKGEIDRSNSPSAAKLLAAIFDELRGIYDIGGLVTEPVQIERIVRGALERTKTSLHHEDMPKIVELFSQRINNALFRHQSLSWLAGMGVDLRLYGRGWDKHPTLWKYARGIADNNNQLCLIYRASKISLQISPHGAVHQRVMEGLASGGFFMIRRCPGDLLEREIRTIWNGCKSNHIETETQLLQTRRPEIQDAIRRVGEMFQIEPQQLRPPLMEIVRGSARDGYLRSAATIWDENYDAVSYGSAAELNQKVKNFLGDPAERRRVANLMREVVLERFTYVATSRRLLRFIADDLAALCRQKAAA